MNTIFIKIIRGMGFFLCLLFLITPLSSFSSKTQIDFSVVEKSTLNIFLQKHISRAKKLNITKPVFKDTLGQIIDKYDKTHHSGSDKKILFYLRKSIKQNEIIDIKRGNKEGKKKKRPTESQSNIDERISVLGGPRISIYKNKVDSNPNPIISSVLMNEIGGIRYDIQIETGRKIDLVIRGLSKKDALLFSKRPHNKNYKRVKLSELMKMHTYQCNQNDCIFYNVDLPPLYHRIVVENEIKDYRVYTFVKSHPGKKIFYRPGRSGKNLYVSNSLPEKLYPNYINVVNSKGEWDLLEGSKKVQTLYWEGLQLKDYQGVNIDDVSKRIIDTKNNTTIFEGQMLQSTPAYSKYIPICIETSLTNHPRQCGFPKRPGAQRIHHILKKSSIYSQRFRFTEGQSWISNGIPPDNDINSEFYPDQKGIASYSKQTGFDTEIIQHKKSEMSISRIPGDFSFDTSCRSNTGLGDIFFKNSINKNNGNCSLEEGVMYYINARAVETTTNHDIIEASTCGIKEYCVISIGASIFTSKNFPIFDSTTDFTGKKGQTLDGPTSIEQPISVQPKKTKRQKTGTLKVKYNDGDFTSDITILKKDNFTLALSDIGYEEGMNKKICYRYSNQKNICNKLQWNKKNGHLEYNISGSTLEEGVTYILGIEKEGKTGTTEVHNEVQVTLEKSTNNSTSNNTPNTSVRFGFFIESELSKNRVIYEGEGFKLGLKGNGRKLKNGKFCFIKGSKNSVDLKQIESSGDDIPCQVLNWSGDDGILQTSLLGNTFKSGIYTIWPENYPDHSVFINIKLAFVVTGGITVYNTVLIPGKVVFGSLGGKLTQSDDGHIKIIGQPQTAMITIVGEGVSNDWDFCIMAGKNENAEYHCEGAVSKRGFVYSHDDNTLSRTFDVAGLHPDNIYRFYFVKPGTKADVTKIKHITWFIPNNIVYSLPLSRSQRHSEKKNNEIIVRMYEGSPHEIGYYSPLLKKYLEEYYCAKSGGGVNCFPMKVKSKNILSHDKKSTFKTFIKTVIFPYLNEGTYEIGRYHWPMTEKDLVYNTVKVKKRPGIPVIPSLTLSKSGNVTLNVSGSTKTMPITITATNVGEDSYICDGPERLSQIYTTCKKIPVSEIHNGTYTKDYNVLGGVYNTFVVNAPGYDNQYGFAPWTAAYRLDDEYTIGRLYQDHLQEYFSEVNSFYSFLRGELNSNTDIRNKSNAELGNISLKKVFTVLRKKSLIASKYLYALKNKNSPLKYIKKSNVVSLSMMQFIPRSFSSRFSTHLNTCYHNKIANQTGIKEPIGQTTYVKGEPITFCSDNVNQNAYICHSPILSSTTIGGIVTHDLGDEKCLNIKDYGGKISIAGIFNYTMKDSGILPHGKSVFYIRNFQWDLNKGGFSEVMQKRIINIIDEREVPKKYSPKSSYINIIGGIGNEKQRFVHQENGYIKIVFKDMVIANAQVCSKGTSSDVLNNSYIQEKCASISEGHMNNILLNGTWKFSGGVWEFIGKAKKISSVWQGISMTSGESDNLLESLQVIVAFGKKINVHYSSPSN